MLNLPINTVLGDLRLVNTFQFFDIPRIFSCRNKSGAQYLVLSTFDDYDSFEWLYLPISNDRLSSVVSKKITLREAFELPEDGYLFHVESNFEGEAKVDYKFSEQINVEDLPKPGAYLQTDSPYIVGFGAIDATEAAISSRRETFNIHLYPTDSQLPEFEIKGFGTILTSLQSLVDSLGQYCEGEPTLKGAIAVDILSETKFKATQIFDGSFGVQLKSDSSSDLFNRSLASDAIMELINLLEAGDNEDVISNKLHEFQGRVASKYKVFLKSLAKLDTPLKVDWGSPNLERGKSLELKKDTILNAYKAVSKINIDMSEAVIFKAELLGLDVKTKRYRVRNLSDNEDYFGKISEESICEVEHSEINGIYEVTLKKVIETNSSSGAEYTKWLLCGLKQLTK
ncbi:hypothetical protein IOQ59_05810 [Pontibacterium sp. N1Y112]|uniref:DUF6575 domain-containing protein n=1 Tax=Pontibacterium sinense TaxID=2781979 RepID=A0A8J7FLP2_9GAMM|nr:DUF6575 domain-containing protein [Pontibacterium sinense]MBE9396777.1 hypothetical protein [Pontibacterium sinense]